MFAETYVSPAPGCSCTIDDLTLPWVGYIPGKTNWVRRSFVSYTINLIVRGSGTFRMDRRETQPVEAGGVLAAWPGPTFDYGPRHGSSWDECFLMAAGPGVQRWIDRGWFPQDGRVRHLPQTRTAVAAFRTLIRLMRRAKPGDMEQAILRAEQLLVHIHYATTAKHIASAAEAELEPVLDYCRQHCARRIDFRALATSNAMSYSKLRQMLRRLTGLSPHRYLAHLRCEKAKILLRESDLTVKQIGHVIGIPHPVVFTRTFSRVVGVCPSEYRRR